MNGTKKLTLNLETIRRLAAAMLPTAPTGTCMSECGLNCTRPSGGYGTACAKECVGADHTRGATGCRQVNAQAGHYLLEPGLHIAVCASTFISGAYLWLWLKRWMAAPGMLALLLTTLHAWLRCGAGAGS